MKNKIGETLFIDVFVVDIVNSHTIIRISIAQVTRNIDLKLTAQVEDYGLFMESLVVKLDGAKASLMCSMLVRHVEIVQRIADLKPLQIRIHRSFPNMLTQHEKHKFAANLGPPYKIARVVQGRS